MRKTILFALVTLLLAASAFATAVTQDYGTALPTPSGGTPIAGKLSTNVLLAYKSETNNTGYTVGAYHSSGTRTYASSSGDATIWVANTTAHAIPAAPVGTASADFSGGDWTSQ
jgi:hypothetical protein